MVRYTAKICFYALDFAVKQNAVLAILGPVDSNPNVTIKQVIVRLIETQLNSAKLEVIFDYTDLTGNDAVSNVHVFLTWYKGGVGNGFVFDNISTSNP